MEGKIISQSDPGALNSKASRQYWPGSVGLTTTDDCFVLATLTYKMRWLRLRFDFGSTAVRLLLSKVIKVTVT